MDELSKQVNRIALDDVRLTLKRLYGEFTSVTVHVTYDGMEITTDDRVGVKGYSMRRINGEWVSKESDTNGKR